VEEGVPPLPVPARRAVGMLGLAWSREREALKGLREDCEQGMDALEAVYG